MKSVFAALLLALMTVACSATTAPQRQVTPEQLRDASFDQSGHAVVLIEAPRELVAVDRRGTVVVPGIYQLGDFDYPGPRGHLARFRDGGKCGYFDVRDFQVRVPATYDQCLAFEEDSAQACNDCQIYCIDSECHGSMLVGGRGVEIDQRARIVRQFKQRSLAQACGGNAGTVERRGSGNAWLNCPPDPQSPFQMEKTHGR